MVEPSPATPAVAQPISILKFPVVKFDPLQMAIFAMPEVFHSSALCPTATLMDPVVLFAKAPSPTAVFAKPVVLEDIESCPIAVFSDPHPFSVSVPSPPVLSCSA